MGITSLTFFLFFAITYILFWSLRGRSRLYLIAISSLVFYSTWSPLFALHFLFMILLNYLFAANLLRNKKKWILGLAVGVNLANLFFFKYFYLFLHFLYDATGQSIFHKEIFNSWLEAVTGYSSITLPLAISFYTFQLVAYIADCYRGVIREKDGILEFFVFILFFPRLVAGPILRHSDFVHQLKEIRPDENKTIDGMYLLFLGLIKKVAVADNMIPALQAVYMAPDHYNWISNLLAPAGYAVRVYADFSGYTDIARGLGKLLGLELPENFYAPYFSRSMREMWQRWHVTLSTWLRDYIYIPLGGSRRGRLRNHINLITTFTLGGLWHGANYTYIIWGFYHGLVLVLEKEVLQLQKYLLGIFRNGRPSGTGQDSRPIVTAASTKDDAARKENPVLQRARVVLLTAYAFTMFAAGLIAFNAPDIQRAFAMTRSIFTLSDGMDSPYNGMILGMLALVYLFNAIQYRNFFRVSSRPLRYAGLFLFGLLTTTILGRFAPGGSDFIYFQF